MTELDQRVRAAVSAAQRGALINAGLVLIKVITGIIGNSYALIADGIESGADVISSLIVWRGLSIAKRGASEDYHFGYGRAETVSGVIVGLMLLGAAVAISIVAVREIITPHHLPELFTLPVLVAVVITKEILYRSVAEVSEETESSALKGDAWHHRSDAITSAAAFIGISIGLWGGPGWEPADDFAALFCALVITITGWRLVRASFAELMDRAPDQAFLSELRTAAASVPEARHIEKVFARKSGLVYFVDLHVHADPTLSLREAHIVSGKVKTAVRRALPSVHGVMVHMEPDESNGTPQQ